MSSASPPILCLTCSSSIDPTGETPPPQHGEKPDPPPHQLACSKHWVCGRCIRVNRRLATCVLCEGVMEILASGSRGPRKATLPTYRELEKDEFVIGDEDDEAELEDEAVVTYEEEGKDGLPSYGGEAEGRPHDAIAEKQALAQPSLHYLKPTETLLGLSLQYNVPGTTLCHLNHLPLSTLNTTPSLLHTLPFLMLPPGSKSSSSTPLLSPMAERRRLILRRFQTTTRCSDWAMASAYVTGVFDIRDKEAEMVRANRKARGDSSWMEVEVREGGELAEAVESYNNDAAWEASQKGKGKVMGSRIKSTGKVEAQVGGWGTWGK